MEENEVESTESGVSEGSSTEASESSSQGSEGGKQLSFSQEIKQPETPFHEHPRFKELVEQKNEALRRHQEMDSRYKALEQQLNSIKESQPKAPSETDALLADLKKIDPRLANVIESQLKAAKTAEDVQKRLEQFEQQSQANAKQQTLISAVAKINSLHESNKMSEFGKQFINNQLDLAYRNGKIDASDLKAVEGAYQEASKAIKAYEDSLKRDTTASYVQDKKKDASVPTSQPKGAPPKAAQKPLNVPKDKEQLRAAVVKSFLKEQAANRDATNS